MAQQGLFKKSLLENYSQPVLAPSLTPSLPLVFKAPPLTGILVEVPGKLLPYPIVAGRKNFSKPGVFLERKEILEG
ncbi:MAG: hypothetical protein QXI60_01925 [Thermofilaceae archaeon]